MIWIIAAILAVLFAIAYMIYRLPTDQVARHRPKQKKEVPQPALETKDWKEIATRWEKKNINLIADVEKMAVNEKRLLKEIEAQQGQLKEMMDKISLEKSWREKELGNLEKFRQHEKDLKDQIIRTEKDLEREHSGRLAGERELQEIRIKLDAVTEEKRQATVNASSLSTTVKQLQAQVRELSRDNEVLKQKREDVQWVAKSEYDELMRKFKEKA